MLRGARGTLSILDQRGSAFTHAWWAFELWVSLQQLEGRSDEGGGFRIDLYTPTTQGGAIGLLDGDAPADGADGARMAATRKVVRERAFPRAWLGRAAISFSLAMLVTSRPHECDVLVQLMTDADAEATLRAYLATCILARGPASERALSLGAGAAAAAGGVGKAAADPSGALIALLDWLGLDALASRCVGGRSQDQYRILNEKAVTAVMLAALRGSQLRRLVAVREVAVEADARRLGAALPASLRSLTLWGLHPAVVGGVARIMRESARVAPLSEPLALGGLRSLELAACGIEAYGAWRLASALSAGSRLERLSLRRNALGDNGARALASALGSHPSLTVLDLSSNGIGDAGGGALARALACRGPGGLGACSLADNRLGAPAGVALGAALLENEALRSLSLGWNRLSNGGVVGLAAGVRASKFLLALELSGNSIGDAGADALADALASNQTLTRLVLQCAPRPLAHARRVEARVSGRDLRARALYPHARGRGAAGPFAYPLALSPRAPRRALPPLPLPSALAPRRNVIGDAGCVALAESLHRNGALLHLSLWSNVVQDKGALALARALAANDCLVELNLASNHIEAAGASAFAGALRSNASLTSLNLSSNLCSAASQRQLVAAWRKSRGKGTAAAHLELGLAPSLDAELAESFPRQGSY
jgi:Ran GTPase-activating protein (RanGAP) involved in mRNA processing and transport